MKKILFLLLSLFIFNQISFGQCSDAALEWDVNAVWNVDDQINTYTISDGAGGTFDVTLEIIDPLNRNDDNDQYTTHPFDPAGGCIAYPGAVGPSEADNVPGDGSIVDPWDSDCNHIYTQSNGAYGSNFLTLGMNAENHSDSVIYKFTFSKPIVLNNFEIGDIDAIGFYYAVTVGQLEYEVPGNSYQDEIFLDAVGVCGDKGVLELTPGSGLIVDSADSCHLMSVYNLYSTNDMPPTDPNHTVYVSSSTAITELTLTYSNGPDEAVEATMADFYTWWSAANGPTNGVSDDQAIRLTGMDYCVCPDLTATIATVEDVCTGDAVDLIASVTGGTEPYTFTWTDGTGTQVGTGSTITVVPTQSTTYSVAVMDSLCCPSIEQLVSVNVTECCAPINCLPVTITKN